jgi:hypothetical protein
MGANAVTTVPVYVAGEVLTAADLNITNSGIPVFAGTTERDAAFGGTGEKVLAEGQYAYLESTNATQFYDGAAWQAVTGGKVAQVVSTTKTDTFSASTSNTFTDITGLSVSITPSSATSKILVTASVIGSATSNGVANIQLLRGATAICIGDTAGSRPRATTSTDSNNLDQAVPASINFLDSPATTSATTYKLAINTGDNTGTAYINRTLGDGDNIYQGRYASTITVMEILA